MKNIAVLLTCHNRKIKTLECLSALFKCDLPGDFILEVFLVDDGCTDGTAEEVSKRYGQVNVVKGTGSLYWNRGMLLAWESAKKAKDFDFYLWLNDDTLLYSTAIIELLECSRQNNDNAIVCGAICSDIDQQFTYGGRDRSGAPIIPDGNIQKCCTINGNCVLISKGVVDAIGLLDPVFPHSIGDHDYGYRAINNGFSVVTTRIFIGTCERNKSLPKWCYSNIPLKERFNSLYSPLGNSHPQYFFIYERRHFGILVAVKHYLSIHLRVLIPSLWKP